MKSNEQTLTGGKIDYSAIRCSIDVNPKQDIYIWDITKLGELSIQTGAKIIKITPAQLLAVPELIEALKCAVKFINCSPRLDYGSQPRGLGKWEELLNKISEK